MIVEHKFFIGLRDVDKNRKIKNTALLSYLEELGGMHSNLIGYGLSNIEETKKTWILLNWKVKVINRPKYADTITVKTWSRGIDKFYAYRDFEVCNENGEVLCIATSKWIFVDINKGKIIKISKEIEEGYGTESKNVFEEENNFEIKEKSEFISCTEFKITRNLIDFNYHVHNIYYLDLAIEALPKEIYNNLEFNNFKILCKREIKLGDNVKVFYSKDDSLHIVTVKSKDEKITHAIINLY